MTDQMGLAYQYRQLLQYGKLSNADELVKPDRYKPIIALQMPV